MRSKLIFTIGLIIIWIIPCCNPYPLTPATPTASIEHFLSPTPIPVFSTPTPTELNFAQSSTTIPPSPSALTPASPLTINLPEYTIQAIYDYETGTLNVDQVVTFANNTNRDLSYLPFFAEINRFTGILAIEKVRVNGLAQENYSLNSNVLLIPFNSGILKPAAEVEISLQYTIHLPQMNSDLGNGIFGRTVYQTNLLDWYFWLPPYQENAGWIIHPPAGFGEHTAYPLANFDITFSITNSPEGLEVTGSTSPVAISENSYQFIHPASRNLFISMSPYFQVSRYQHDGINVNCFTFQGHETATQLVVDSTVRALQIYGAAISPYQHSVLNIVETNFVDGLESDGMYFLGSSFFNNQSTTRSLLTLLAVHETAHQWWYAGIANDQAMEPWLDESFATFMEGIFFASVSEEDYTWWKGYRFSIPISPSPVNSPLYNFSSFRPYRDAVYLGGARFLLDLKNEMGEEQFFNFMTDYYHRAANQSLTTADLFLSTLNNYYQISGSEILSKYFTKIEDD